MNEIEMMQRLAALESEVKTLKKQKFEGMKQVAVEAIRRKYPNLNLDDRYELLFESACHHVEIKESDSQFDVTSKIEAELRNVCKKANIEEPTTGNAIVESYLKKRQLKENDNQTYAEQVAESFAK